MNYADEIKSRLKMPEVLDYYGIERNRANRIRCVLHNGQDFNLTQEQLELAEKLN